MQLSPVDGSRTRIFWGVTLGHFGIDVFNSMGPVLVAFMALPLGLRAGQVGLAVGVYQFLAGSTQPGFGWLVDRIGSRLLGPSSVAWVLGFLCLSLLAAEESGFVAFLLLFSCAALGSGAFHPQGTMHAGTAVPGRSAATTSVFFLFGQCGLAAGPVLAGFVLDRLGISGVYLLALVFAPVPLYMAWAMGSATVNPPPAKPGRLRFDVSGVAGTARQLMHSVRPGVLGLLIAIFSLRAWTFIGTAAFLPLLFQREGWSATRQGLIVGAFWLGGAVGGVVAGDLADRLGRRRVVCGTTLLGALFLPLLPLPLGAISFVIAASCGAFLGAPHSTLMVVAQDLLPVKRGLSSGLALGFLFAMGAVSSWAIGMLADHFDLRVVLQCGAALAFLMAVLSLLLPVSREISVPASIEAIGSGP